MLTVTYNKRYECDRCGAVNVYKLEDVDEIPAGWHEVYGEFGNHTPAPDRHLCECCYTDFLTEFIAQWDGKHNWERSEAKQDDSDHYRGYCPNCKTILEDIAMWNENGTKHHSVYYCPNCGEELRVEPPFHIEPIIPKED